MDVDHGTETVQPDAEFSSFERGADDAAVTLVNNMVLKLWS